MSSTITAMHVRPVDTVEGKPVIEVRIWGKVFLRWNDYYFVWRPHRNENWNGPVGWQFDLTDDITIMDLVDAEINTVLGQQEYL